MSEPHGGWTQTASYPGNQTAGCAEASGHIYCLGGFSNQVYYATLNASGVGTWTTTTPYPVNISSQSCVAAGGYLYCLSGIGQGQGPRPTPADYFAPILNSGGLGQWSMTTSYPSPSLGLSCSISSGYVYCVGGENTEGTLETNNVYSAPVSSSGIGTWVQETSYPITVTGTSCLTDQGFLYCFGGYTASGPKPVSNTYFASISSGDVGSWTAGVPYPDTIYNESCVAQGSEVYCIGGIGSSGPTSTVETAALDDGIGTWSTGPPYPSAMVGSCVSAQGVIACLTGNTSVYVEGETPTVYYIDV